MTAQGIISTLALVHERLRDVARDWGNRPEVTSVTTAVNHWRHMPSLTVDCYVDAELASGNAIALWLEFRCENEQ